MSATLIGCAAAPMRSLDASLEWNRGPRHPLSSNVLFESMDFVSGMPCHVEWDSAPGCSLATLHCAEEIPSRGRLLVTMNWSSGELTFVRFDVEDRTYGHRSDSEAVEGTGRVTCSLVRGTVDPDTNAVRVDPRAKASASIVVASNGAELGVAPDAKDKTELAKAAEAIATLVLFGLDGFDPRARCRGPEIAD